MRLSLRSLAFIFAAAAALAYATPAGAVCQVPLTIGQSSGEANVILLLDNSISMNEVLVSDSYNPNIKGGYPGFGGSTTIKFAKGNSYGITVSNNYTPRTLATKLGFSNKNSFPTTPTAYLVASDGRASAYDGDYLNWVFFTATAAQRAAIPQVTRIQASKAVLNTVLAGINNCRFAVEIFNGKSGTVIGPFGSTVAAMQGEVNSAIGDQSTPLAGALVKAMRYFADSTNSIQASCQKSFVIIVTDGMPNSDISSVAALSPLAAISDTDHNGYVLDNVAGYMYRNDLRPNATGPLAMDGIQNAAVFTIGFNVDATATTLLQRTADEGGGAYFSINNPAGLEAALAADFNVIAARVSAGTAVSVVSSEDRMNNRLYRARYESQTWKGFLEAFNLPYHAGNDPLWESGALLAARSPYDRNVFTSISGTTKTAFTLGNAASLMTSLAAADVSTATNIIKYALGDSVLNTRGRSGWKLGDIVDAAPVAVGKPNGFSNQAGYPAFRALHASRPEVVYVAANDGMLHCFDAGTGVESWAYAARNQLPKLKELMDPAYCHDYFLNMTPVAYDIYVNGAWKTVVIGGNAQGGSGLFALDVTTPSADTVGVMWDIDLAALHGSWNGPALIRDHNRNAHVLAVGTGYAPAVTQTNLLVLDPADGSVLSTFALGSPLAANKTTKAVALDRDFDGYDDLLYLGDLSGRIYRVNLTTNPWTVTTLFSCGQPIQAAPALGVDALGRAMLFFGTGEFLTGSDPSNTSQQTIYGIIDDNSGATLTTANLVNQSNTFTALTAGQRGWYVNLTQQAGERVTRSPALIAGTLYVPSFLPNSNACTGGGQSWLYTLDYKDGSAPDHANGTANNTTNGRVESMGDGILADPSVDLLNEQVILQSSNAVLLTQDISAGVRRLIVRSWRQKFD
jgi:type IV pilus assembly protein PilY1